MATVGHSVWSCTIWPETEGRCSRNSTVHCCRRCRSAPARGHLLPTAAGQAAGNCGSSPSNCSARHGGAWGSTIAARASRRYPLATSRWSRCSTTSGLFSTPTRSIAASSRQSRWARWWRWLPPSNALTGSTAWSWLLHRARSPSDQRAHSSPARAPTTRQRCRRSSRPACPSPTPITLPDWADTSC